MKIRFNLLSSLVVIALLSLASCGDDAAPSKTLIVSSKWNGTFYTVNTESGSLTELFTPTLNGNTLTELRGLVYHSKEKKYFATTTYNGGGDIYSIDPATGEATLFLENQGWTSVTGLTIADDNSLFGHVQDYYNGSSYQDGFISISTNGTWDETVILDPWSTCCGLTMVKLSNNSILMSNAYYQDDGQLELFYYNEDGSPKSGLIITEFIGFDEEPTDNWWVARSMASESGSTKDPIYTILRNYDDDKTYFAKIDLTKATITKIADWDGDVEEDYSGMTFVSKSVVD